MAKKTENVENEETVENITRYLKKQLVSSKKYASNRDLIQVLLEDNKTYTLEEVESKINEFKKRKV